jgi:hypothetical protein
MVAAGAEIVFGSGHMCSQVNTLARSASRHSVAAMGFHVQTISNAAHYRFVWQLTCLSV